MATRKKCLNCLELYTVCDEDAGTFKEFYCSEDCAIACEPKEAKGNKVHYAPSGEWGNPRTACGRYWTSDVLHGASKNEVTCKHCLKLF